MASRFWVGGTGSWADTTHWAATTGGAGSAGVPTQTDDAFFDANSFSSAAQTVSLGASGFAKCKSITWTGATNSPTLSSTGGLLEIHNGSLTFISAMTVTGVYLSFVFDVNSSSATITTAGKTLSGGQIVPSVDTITGCTVTLGSALTSSSDFVMNLTGGSATTTFNTANFNINVTGNFYINSDWTTNFGSSTVTVTGDCDLDYSGTSLNRMTASSATFILSGADSTSIYYFTSPSAVVGTLQVLAGRLMYAFGTINTLTLSAGKTYTISGSTTGLNIGTLNALGTAGNLITITGATAQTLVKTSGIVAADYLSLTNIVASGGATWYAGSHSTNGGGNTGWIFADAPRSKNSMLTLFT